MTQRTRYFLLGSVLVILVGLCTGLVAYYNGALPLRSSSVGPAELAYLPADAAAVGFANVHEIMSSEFRQKLKQFMPTGEEKDKLQAETGVDIEHDIDTVVAGFVPGEPTEKGAIVLVRGRFDEAKIEGVAVAHGATVEDYKGKKLIRIDSHDVSGTHGHVSGTGGLAFLEPGLLAMGDVASVQKAIDTGISRDDVTRNTDLMKYVADVDRTSNAWLVGQFDAVSQSADLPAEIKAKLPAVQWFVVSAHVDGGVNGTVRADARDDQAGENLRDVVRGGLAAAHLMAGKDARLDTLVDSVQVSGAGKTVAVSFSVPPEIFDIINGLGALKHLNAGGGH
jgi:hypothetical protein